MQIALRITRQQLSLRAVLMTVGGALMIIVGLLGMHTFSADAAGHGAVSSHYSMTTATDHSALTTGNETVTSVPCDDTCLTGTGQGHSDMLTACILALLAGLLLLLRPVLLNRLASPLQVLVSSLRLHVVQALPRAPSLIFLSISRT